MKCVFSESASSIACDHEAGNRDCGTQNPAPPQAPLLALETRSPRSTVIIADGPDLYRTLRRANRDRPLVGHQRLNLRALRKSCGTATGISSAMLLANKKPGVAPAQLTEFVSRLAAANWRFVVAADELPGLGPMARPIDEWLRLWVDFECRYAPTPSNLVVLTHRPEVVAALRNFLSAGLTVTLIGLLGFFDPLIAELPEDYPQRCSIRDIELDCRAVKLAARWASGTRHPHPKQLLSDPQ